MLPLLALLGIVLLIVLPVSALASWWYLAKSGDRPTVFLARFSYVAPETRTDAINHFEAIQERLGKIPELAESFQLRFIPEPVTREQAESLLEVSGGRAAIFGKVLSSGGRARWTLEMLIQWPRGDGVTTNVRITEPKTLTARSFTRKSEPAPYHEEFVDADQPLSRLAAETFDADHANRVVGTLLVLAGVLAGEDDVPTMRERLSAAEQLRSSLSPQTCAALETRFAFIEDIDDPRKLLAHLVAAGNKDADHVDLWNEVVTYSFLLYASGEISSADHLANAKRAVQADPSHATANYNLGEAYLSDGDPDNGLKQFEKVALAPDYSGRYDLFLGIGSIHYNHTKDLQAAREAYLQSLKLRTTAEGHLFLADTYWQLDERKAAQRHYRQALRLDRTLVDAYRGYWAVRDQPQPGASRWDRLIIRLTPDNLRVRRFLRPLRWALLRWRYARHPEDERLHYMLGANALVQEDFELAEERLRFTDELFEGRDLEAKARLAVAVGLQGRLDEAKKLLGEVRSGRLIPGAHTAPDGSSAGRLMMVMAPFVEEPALGFPPHGEALGAVIQEVFADAWPSR